MRLELTDREHDLLVERLKYDLGELRMEIRDTDGYEFRLSLKQDEEVLRGLINQLEGLDRIPAI